MTYHDLVIVGAGPAGLTSAIYANRADVDALTIESGSYGGQISQSDMVDNYPGIESISGFDLGEKMHKHAEDLGAAFSTESVKSITYDKDTERFHIEGAKDAYESKAVIYATGGTPRPAGFEGEDRFRGHGVSYCATCDGMFYRNKDVYVVGGGNTAAEEADFLARICASVTVVVRKDHMRAQASLIDKIENNPKINIMYNTSITKLEGDNLPEAVTLHNNVTGEDDVVTGEPGSFGVFVLIGTVPSSGLVKDLVEVNNVGEIATNERMETATPGLYAVGDVRQTPLRQVVTAAADGAVAAHFAAQFLGQLVI